MTPLLWFINGSLIAAIAYNAFACMQYILLGKQVDQETKKAGDYPYFFVTLLPYLCYLATGLILSWQVNFGYSLAGLSIIFLYVLDAFCFDHFQDRNWGKHIRYIGLTAIQAGLAAAIFLSL